MNTKSPPSHMIPPAACWSSSGVGPHGAAGRRVVRVERRRGQVDREGEERVLGHLRGPTYRTLADGLSFHGDGSGPTTGHQNSSAAARNRACSSRWTHGFSRARSNSGEKWLAHMTAGEQRPTTTTGNDSRPDDPRVEHGQDPAPARLGRRRLEEQRDRPGEQQERRPDQRQQQVLDHVQREQRRVVGGEPGVERVQDREHADDPVDRPAARRSGGRMRPVRPAGRPRRHSSSASDRGQPGQRVERPAEQRGSRRRAAPGPSAPWARTARGGRASRRPPTPRRQARTARRTALPGERAGAGRRGSRAPFSPLGPMRSRGRDRHPAALVPHAGRAAMPAARARRV